MDTMEKHFNTAGRYMPAVVFLASERRQAEMKAICGMLFAAAVSATASCGLGKDAILFLNAHPDDSTERDVP